MGVCSLRACARVGVCPLRACARRACARCRHVLGAGAHGEDPPRHRIHHETPGLTRGLGTDTGPHPGYGVSAPTRGAPGGVMFAGRALVARAHGEDPQRHRIHHETPGLTRGLDTNAGSRHERGASHPGYGASPRIRVLDTTAGRAEWVTPAGRALVAGAHGEDPPRHRIHHETPGLTRGLGTDTGSRHGCGASASPRMRGLNTHAGSRRLGRGTGYRSVSRQVGGLSENARALRARDAPRPAPAPADVSPPLPSGPPGVADRAHTRRSLG